MLKININLLKRILPYIIIIGVIAIIFMVIRFFGGSKSNVSKESKVERDFEAYVMSLNTPGEVFSLGTSDGSVFYIPGCANTSVAALEIAEEFYSPHDGFSAKVEYKSETEKYYQVTVHATDTYDSGKTNNSDFDKRVDKCAYITRKQYDFIGDRGYDYQFDKALLFGTFTQRQITITNVKELLNYLSSTSSNNLDTIIRSYIEDKDQEILLTVYFSNSYGSNKGEDYQTLFKNEYRINKQSGEIIYTTFSPLKRVTVEKR